MRARLPRLGDRAIGIALGLLLGIAVILIFLFIGSRSTIDEPSINNIPGAQTQTQGAPPSTVSKPNELK
jgi:hypothetical protein